MNPSETLQFRWWFLPSWLGLDAPCVVSIWCLAIASSIGRETSFKIIAALFLVVWSIYLTDRLIDVVQCPDWRCVSGRMNFGRRYWWLFVLFLSVNVLGLSLVFAIGLPATVFRRGILVGLGMVIYFALFVSPVLFRKKLPGKEFGVGLFFSLGCYCVLGMEFNTVPMFVGVAGLIAFNCLVISARDREVDSQVDPGAASQWWRQMDRDLTVVGSALVVLTAGCASLGFHTLFSSTLSSTFLLLVLLHRNSARYSPDAIRALADYVLFTPLAFLLW